MSKTIIIGGGITGLAASLFMKLKDKNTKVILFEASDRLGGWIRSKRFTDGAVHELGPRTIRMQSPTINNMLKIIDNVNITDKIISILKTNKIFQKRYIFAHNKLHLLDFSLLKPAQKPFTESFLKKMVKSSLLRYNHENNFKDLPVDYFVRTRFGDEIADYIVDPIIRGIYACDSRELSMQATFSNLLQFEKTSSNVIIGALRQYLESFFKWNEVSRDLNSQELINYANNSSVISFKGGLETLIDKMVEKVTSLDVDISTGIYVVKIKTRSNGGYIIQTIDNIHECDRIIIATPSYITSVLLNEILSDAKLLNQIQWNTVAVVVLEYKGYLMKNKGFGHLIPSWEIADVLGVIYDSCILPEHDGRSDDTTRFTVMLGGSWFTPDIINMDSESLIKKSMDVLKSQLNITGELIRSTVSVNHNCIPLYGLKHKDLVMTVRQSILVKDMKIRLCGNSYDGVSLSDCVQSANNAVDSFFT